MKSYQSIKFKLSLPIISLLLFVFVTSSLVIIERESQALEDSLKTSAMSFSELSKSEIIRNYETYYDSGFLKFSDIIKDFLELNPDITRIQIFDINNKIHFDSTEESSVKYDETLFGIRYIEDDKIIERIASIEASSEIIQNTDSFDIIQPYIDDWDRHHYSIRYIVSTSRLSELENQMITIITFYSAIFFAISLSLILILLNHFITSPLKIFIQGVKKVGSGELEQRVDIKSKDEFGELSNSFNKMTKDLKDSKETLEDYSKKLEELIEQKNQFINQLSHDLKSPLGPVINSIFMLKKDEYDQSKKELLEVYKILTI